MQGPFQDFVIAVNKNTLAIREQTLIIQKMKLLKLNIDTSNIDKEIEQIKNLLKDLYQKK
jgi:hypothetical protein